MLDRNGRILSASPSVRQVQYGFTARNEKIVKITAAKVFVCCPGRNFVTLKLTTDEGVSGLGDATLNGRELAVASYLEDHVCPLLVGRGAARTEDTWQYLDAGAYWRGGPVGLTAVSAVGTALLHP